MKTLIKTFIILTVMLIAAGCSVHSPMLKKSTIAFPDSYTSEELRESPPHGNWWKWFNDEKLNALVEDALQNNLDIAQSYERLQQSLAIVRTTNAARGPALNITGSGKRAKLSGTTANTYQLSAAASFEIDLWNRLGAKTEASKLDAFASQEDLKSLYISISAQVADLYYLAIEQRAQLELSDNTIASYQDALTRVESRYRHGLVPAIDLYQARQNFFSVKAQRPVFEKNLATTLNALSVLTGRFPDKEIGGDAKILKEVHKFPTGIPSQLLANRPDVRAAFIRINAADERVGAAIADRFPSFSLTGAYGGSHSETRNILDSPNILWNIMLQAALPIIDSGNRKAEVERTRAVFRENLAAYHKKILNAFKEVEDSLIKNSTSEERIIMLEKNTSASESSLRIAMDRYTQGLTDYLPVLSEQQRHFNVKSSLLSARRQLISDRIELARSLGGTWINCVYEKCVTTNKQGSNYEQ